MTLSTFFGTTITLLGIAIAVAQTQLARWANKASALAEEESLKREKEAAEAAQRRQLTDDKRMALAICESLATREVVEILSAEEPSPHDLAFLRNLHGLCQVRISSLLSDAVFGDPTIAAPVAATLDPVTDFLTRHGEKVDESAVQAKLGTTDRSRFLWDGEGPVSKIRTINLIAERWAREHALTSVEAFARSFGAELEAAVPDRAGTFNAAQLLQDRPESAIPDLLLELDGRRWAIRFPCGFKNQRVGVEVHLPVIDHFATRHGYPVRPA